MTGLPSLKDLVASELARRASTERPITIRRIIVKPIHDGNDRRVGSRVWDEKGVELDEHDPRFRPAVCGLIWRGEPPQVDDEDTHGITDGAAIFRRAAEPDRRAVARPALPLPDGAADEGALDRAQERIAARRAP
jgi:hypothetical protein